MAKRYGGAYSPGKTSQPQIEVAKKANRFRGQNAHKSNLRVKFLFFAPLPLLFSGIGELRSGDGIGALFEWGALGLLLLAAYLLRDGLAAEEAYNARTIARPPVFPRKIFSSVLTGLGVAAAASGGSEIDIISSVLFGLGASVAHIFSFGIDPMRAKGMDGVNAAQNDRAAKAIEAAKKMLKETLEASHNFQDRALETRIQTLAVAVRDMLNTVEQDPRDLTRARKFLSVYLKGARDATRKFADLYAKTQDQNIRADYEALLGDLERGFANQREKLLLDDRTDLDVEIEVLRDRLKQDVLKT